MKKPPQLRSGYKANFDTLVRAVRAGDVCLMSCRDKVTGQARAVVCAVNRNGEMIETVPVAKLFDGDPYEELVSPQGTS